MKKERRKARAFRSSEALWNKIKIAAKRWGGKPSDIIRMALEEYLKEK